MSIFTLSSGSEFVRALVSGFEGPFGVRLEARAGPKLTMSLEPSYFAALSPARLRLGKSDPRKPHPARPNPTNLSQKALQMGYF